MVSYAFVRNGSLSLKNNYPRLQRHQLSPLWAVTWKNRENEPIITDVIANEDIYQELSELIIKERSKTSTSIEVTDEVSEIVLGEEQEQNKERDILIARALILGAAALYGTNFAFVKTLIVSENMSVGAMTSLRFFLASLFTCYWLLPSSSSSSASSSSDTDENIVENKSDDLGTKAIVAGLEIGVWNAIGYIGQAVGLQTMDAGKSAFICSLAVVVVPILDSLTGKRMSGKAVVGSIMALIGVALLEVGDGIFNFADAGSLSMCDLGSYIQPIMFGIGFWRMEHAMEKYSSQAQKITAAQLFAIFVMASIYYVSAIGGSTPPDFQLILHWMTNPSTLGALAWTGLITTALTIYMETLALKSLSAAETTLLFSTEPLWGAAFASFMLHETLGLNAGVGAFFILSGIYITNCKTKA